MKNFWRILGIVAFLILSIQVAVALTGSGEGIIALPDYPNAVVICGECGNQPDKVEIVKNLWGKPVATVECFGTHMMTINPTHHNDPQVAQLRDLALDKCALLEVNQ